MHSRLTMMFALAATLAAPAIAEPLKAPVQPPASRPAEVLLASSEVRTPGPQADGQAAAPVRRPRAARVTTCRCGGQTPQQP